MFHPLLNLSVTDDVKTSVSYACNQIRLCRFFPEVAVASEKADEDVVHYILALSIIMQKYVGQPIHLTVMLFEQLLESFLFCHTLIIHTKTDLLNPKQPFFYKTLKKVLLLLTHVFFIITLRRFSCDSKFFCFIIVLFFGVIIIIKRLSIICCMKRVFRFVYIADGLFYLGYQFVGIGRHGTVLRADIG